MAKIGRFEDIKAWQKARKIDFEVYNCAENSELFYKDFALKDQIERTRGSIIDDIAEGFERVRTKEFILFFNCTKGSCGEVRYQLFRALDSGDIEKETFD